MGNKVYWIGVAAVLTLGVILARHWGGSSPASEPILKFSSFSSTQEIASSILSNLEGDLAAAPVVLFGIEAESPEHLEIVSQFISEAKIRNIGYQRQVWDSQIPAPRDNSEVLRFDSRTHFSNVVAALQQALDAKDRTVVVVPATFSSQLAEQNFAQAIKSYKIPILSFSVFPLLRSREQENGFSYPCNVEGTDRTGIGRLGCAILQASRPSYRNKKSPGSMVGLMNRVGENDYLILLGREVRQESK